MGRVIVVGGGLAGVAATIALAERGVSVELVERNETLGGRLAGFADRLHDGTEFHMERGFHAFFRHYENLRALLRRVDPTLSMLRPVEDYPIIGPNDARESFAGLPKRAPFNVLALMWRSPSMAFRDLIGVDLNAARELLAFDPLDTYARLDDESARSYLDRLGFPVRARQMLFDVFAHSFFNPEDHYSAAEMVAMFHYYFTGNPKGLTFDCANEDFSSSVWRPLEDLMHRCGVTIHMSSTVSSIAKSDGGDFEVTRSSADGTTVMHSDCVVLATDVAPLQKIVAASPTLRALRPSVDSLEVTRPFAVLRLWLDTPCKADRAAFAGTSGLGALDSISIYDRLEGESREWAQKNQGSVVELHAYAVDTQKSESDLREELIATLRTVYSELRDARVVEERMLIRRDCPAFAPGSYRTRPVTRTDVSGLTLAGDYLRLPFPSALMERAVTSGFFAANQILRDAKLPEVPIQHGPLRGLFASKRRRDSAA